jgi:hypothetical protein
MAVTSVAPLRRCPTSPESVPHFSGIRIYRGTAPTNLAPLTSIPASKISYSDTGLTGGTTYYYAVQAVDTGSNTSPMSTVVAATTPK